jgi:hypothetical protein
LIANAPNSTLHFNGNANLTLTQGVYQGGIISNIIVSQSGTTLGLSLANSLLVVGNLTVNSGGLFNLNGQNLTVMNNLTNNGLINSTTAASRITMAGTVAQTISGSGDWTTGSTNRLNNLTINNTSGANPAVNFNVSTAIQTELYLQEGILNGTGVLTQGIGSASTFTLRRHAGSLHATFVPLFDLTDVTYNAFYGNSLAPIVITMGNEFPYAPTHTINSFTANFSSAGGRVNLTGHVNTGSAGVLSITNTLLNLGAFDFTISNSAAASLAGAVGSINNMIVADGTGQFRRTIPSPSNASTYVFPIGDLNGTTAPFTHYSPAQFVFASNTQQRVIGIRVTNAEHPQNTVNGPQTDYVNRYWTFTDSEDGNGTYSFAATASHFRFDYSTSDVTDVNGTTSNYRLNRWDAIGSNWVQFSSTVSGTGVFTNTINNNASARLIGDYTIRNNPYTEYTWLPTSGTEDWNDPTNWNPQRFAPFPTDVLNFTEGGSSTATNVPSESVGRIYVANATNISLEGTLTNRILTLGNIVSPDTVLSVSPTSTLRLISSGANQTTINFANIATSKTRIHGIIDINANTALNNTINFANLLAANNIITGTINNNGGLMTSTAAQTTMDATAVYNHNRNGSAVPAATWDPASLFIVTGIDDINPTGLNGQTFGRFTWQPSAQTGDISLNLSGTTSFNGDFTVVSTGSGRLALATTTATVNMNGDLIIQAGDFAMQGYTGNTAVTINLLGNYNQSGGSFTSTLTPSGTGIQTMNFVAGSNRNYTVSGGTFNTLSLMNFNVNTGAELTLNNGINLGSPTAIRTFTNNGTLWLGNHIISGDVNTSFVNTSVATVTLGVGHPQGIAVVADGNIGNIRTGTTRTYGILANYVFYGAAANTGSGFTNATSVTFENVDINLSVPVLITGISNALTLNTSRVSLGNNDLTFNNTNHTFTGTAFGDNNMIVTNGDGRLLKAQPAISTPTTILFPIGTFDVTDGYEYSPASFDFINSTATGTLAGRVVKGSHPDIAQPSASPDFLERWWKFDVTSGLASYVIVQDGIKLYYKQDDFNGSNENLLSFTRWGGTEWNPFGSSVDATNNIVSSPVSGTITNTTPFFNLTGEFTGRNTPIQYHYRTVANGDWSAPATWEISTDPAFSNPTPVSATTIGLAPTADNSLSILIRLGHQVAVTANVTADQLSIDNTANSRLTINNGVVFTLADGPGNDLTVTTNSRLDVNGTLENFGQISGSSTTISNFFAGSVYDHRQNAGTIPNATWNVTSTCLLESITTAAPAGLGNAFGNFTWNNAGQSNDISLANALLTVNGNLTVSNTGTPTASDLIFGTSYTLSVGGNFNVSNGSRVILTNGATTTAATLNVLGDLNISDANTLLDFRNSVNSTGAETINLTGNYNQTNGTVTRTGVPSGAASANLVFTAGPNRNFTQSGGAFTTNGLFNFTVNINAELTLNNSIDMGTPAIGTRTFTNNGTLWLGNHIISGDVNTSFVNTSVATVTLGVGHPQGIAQVADGAIGNIRTGTTRTYGILANYIFYGAAANTGSGFTNATSVTFENVDINLSVPVLITGISNALTLNTSRVSLGNNDLTFNNTNHTFTGTAFGDNNMIVTNGDGRLLKAQPAISTPTTILFPIGTFDVTDGYEYSPASFDFINSTATGTLAGRVVKGSHPDIATPAASSDFLERWWKFDVTSGLATYVIAQDGIKLYYKQDDFNGSNENQMVFNRWGGTEWNPFGSSVDAVNNIISAPVSGTITQVTPFFTTLNGSEFTGRNTPIPYHYRTVANGDWSAPATWEISTDPAFSNPAPVSATTIGLAPTADNSLSILIRLGHQVAVTANVTADQLSIDNTANSRLTINNGVEFTLADGPGNDLTVTTNSRLDVNGTLVNFGQISGSTATISNFFANSVYDHRQDAGIIPTATWNVSSTCLLESITSAAPTAGLNNTFGNFTWNNAGQVNNIFLNGTLANVTGNLTVSNTGTPTASDLILTNGTLTLNIGGNFNINNNARLIISSQGTTSLSTINLSGDLNISGVNTLLDFRNAGHSSGSETFNIGGNYNQTGGTVTRTGTPSSSGVANIFFTAGPNRNFTQSGGAFTTNGLFNFTVNLGAELTLNNSINMGIPPSSFRTFTNSGTLWMGNNIISGLGDTRFTNTSALTTTLGIGSSRGIALLADGNVGNIQTAGIRTYGTLSNYVYNSSVTQITGSGLTTCNNLTIDNAAGVTQQNEAGVTQNVIVTSTLSLIDGTYNIGGTVTDLNTLTLNGTAISPLASTNLLSNQFSNLNFGPGTGNANPDLYIPSSITNLNALTINIQAVNTVTQNSNISLHSSAIGLTLSSGR